MNGPASIIALDDIPRLLNNAPPAYAPLPPPQPIFVEEPAPKKARHNEVKDFSALTFRELEAIHRKFRPRTCKFLHRSVMHQQRVLRTRPLM